VDYILLSCIIVAKFYVFSHIKVYMQNGRTSLQNDIMTHFNNRKCVTRSSSRERWLNRTTVGEQRQGSLRPSIGPTISHKIFKV